MKKLLFTMLIGLGLFMSNELMAQRSLDVSYSGFPCEASLISGGVQTTIPDGPTFSFPNFATTQPAGGYGPMQFSPLACGAGSAATISYSVTSTSPLKEFYEFLGIEYCCNGIKYVVDIKIYVGPLAGNVYINGTAQEGVPCDGSECM